MTPPKNLDQQIKQLEKEIQQLQKEIQQLEKIYKPKPNSPTTDKPKKQNPTKKIVAPPPPAIWRVQKVDSPAYDLVAVCVVV